ncbi:MAG: pyridoxamine 5'-phosphate oxidase [Synechococcus lacustris]|jgi:pyridoxamine 5'-phosphate oxidase
MEAPAHPDISQLRRDYRRDGLRRTDLDADPVAQFRLWFGQAAAAELLEPNAMVLGTTDGVRPSCRTVLLKAFDGRGFVFFTNYASRKASEIGLDPHVSLLFPWYALERQVAILGKAERIPTTESLAYFVSRPFGSRLGAWVSQQSSVISSRQILESKWEELKQRFAAGEVPLPSAWGGIRVVPTEFEFWQGRENRLHDRFRYRPAAEGWTVERLAP